MDELASASDLVEKLKETISQKISESEIKPVFILLGGSLARNENHSLSDVDIVVSYPEYKRLNAKKRIELKLQISEWFENLVPAEKIDISIIEGLPIKVQFEILKEGKVIYEQEEEKRLDFKEKVMKEYYDYKIWYEQFLKQAVG